MLNSLLLGGLVSLILFNFGLSPVNAQTQPAEPTKVYQLSGMVLSRVNGHPVPLVRINTQIHKRVAFTNEDGFFSLPVIPKDTLIFSRVGYKTAILSIADYLKNYKADANSHYIYEIQYMMDDTITLPTVTIYPYNTPADIRNAILYMKEPINLTLDDASNNVNPALISALLGSLPSNKDEQLRILDRRAAEIYGNLNNRPNVGLDAAAVVSLVRYLTKKKQGVNNVAD